MKRTPATRINCEPTSLTAHGVRFTVVAYCPTCTHAARINREHTSLSVQGVRLTVGAFSRDPVALLVCSRDGTLAAVVGAFHTCLQN